MRRIALGLLMFVLVFCASTRSRAVDVEGADTLENLVQLVINGCSGISAPYCAMSGGSTFGEQEMNIGAQEIAPMTRFLAPGVAGGTAASEGFYFALDAATVVGAVTETSALGCTGLTRDRALTAVDSNGVPGLDCPGCTANVYTFADWRDALRVLYVGQHHDAATTVDCNSDVRRSLASALSNVFQQTCAAGTCGALRHLWAPSTESGTRDVFLELIGAPSEQPFCNQSSSSSLPGDYQDSDPIRTPCLGTGSSGIGEQVCQSSGTLGLVLPIVVPDKQTPPAHGISAGHCAPPTNVAYPSVACSPGVFQYKPAYPPGGLCPNGTGPVFGNCLTPVNSNPSIGAACLASKTTRPFGAPPTFDGRVYNTILRRPDGIAERDKNFRQIFGAYYRIQSTITAGGSVACTEQSSTMQAGCLAQASPCTLGLAGRPAAFATGVVPTKPGVVALDVDGVPPAAANLHALLVPGADPLYPLAHPLWLNTLIGFETLSGNDRELAECLADPPSDSLITAEGFAPLPAARAPACEPFASGSPASCIDECLAGAPSTLDDGNPCTADVCDEGGANHTPLPSGTSCADTDACDGEEQCDGSGVCVAGVPIATDDGNSCTDDACDPATGAVSHQPLPSGSTCTTDACHASGTCSAGGSCDPGALIVVDDGDPCTVEVCDPVQGVVVHECAPIDPTVATVPTDGNSWIYADEDPLQEGVAPGTIVRTRGSVLRGLAISRNGEPIPNVDVTVVGRPEFGSTVTQADGVFAMVVNGGGTLVLRLQTQGYLVADRSVDVPWTDYVQVPDVVLVPADPEVTPVDLEDVTSDFQVAESSPSVDEDGERQGRLLVPMGTEALMKFADGSSEPIQQMNVRITEFTVGDSGPEAMPAALPPQSAYTYAFEVNADEAVSAGADSITFSQPLIYYVDNFLDFPAGTVVPVGSYDRTRTAWTQEKNGLVLDIVSVTGGTANLSIDADAAAESPAELLTAGITLEEREQIAQLYAPGDSLWRVELPHFTESYDCNWGGFAPADAISPALDNQIHEGDAPTDTCEDPNASTIECETQTLREEVPLAGTPFSLHYSSSRVLGRRDLYTANIRLSGATVPASLERIELTVEVAARTLRYSFGPAANQEYAFEWDGRDASGRALQGPQQAKITLGYAYQLVYQGTADFGAFGDGVAITGDRARNEIVLSTSWSKPLGTWNGISLGLGGWSLGVHHNYDPLSQTLFRGDGRREHSHPIRLVASTIRLEDGGTNSGFRRIVAAPDGSVYVSGGYPLNLEHTVRRITTTGSATIVAGITTTGGAFAGDGGPATAARLNHPMGLALAADGSLYIADHGNHRVRRVSPEGVITTVAGNGTAGGAGDGGQATLAQLNNPRGLAIAADGTLYIADRGNGRVRRVDPKGAIHAVAGNGTPGNPFQPPSENVIAGSSLDRLDPDDIAIAKDGSLLVTDWQRGLIRRVAANGRVTTFAGVKGTAVLPAGPYLEGVQATASTAGYPHSIDVAPDGSVYYANRIDGAIRVITPDGTTRTVVGRGTNHSPLALSNVPATDLELSQLEGVAVGPNGLWVLDNFEQRLFLVRPGLPAVSTGNMTIPSNDGREVYLFDSSGRHLTTREAFTGATLYTFEYDSAGLLLRVRDAANNVTEIERSGGIPVAIVGPYGHRTEIDLDANGYVESLTNPGAEAFHMVSTPEGLLTSFQNARGFASVMTYDSLGRLETDANSAGGLKTLTRTNIPGGWVVDKDTLAEGTTSYRFERLLTGQERRTNTFPDGTQAIRLTETSGVVTTTLPDGTIITETPTTDPRFGMVAPIVSRTTRMPSGLTRTEARTRTITLSNPGDPLTVTSFIEDNAVNTRIWHEQYTGGGTRQWNFRTPANRNTFVTLNTRAQPIQTQIQGFLAQTLGYDGRGRLGTVTHTPRVTTYGYFNTVDTSNGYLASVTNALTQTTAFTRDPVGRALTEVAPDTTTTTFGWDESGNLTSVTPPGRPPHTMEYTPVDLNSEYAPPVLASIPDGRTIYEYDEARHLDLETRPDGTVIDYVYDAAGRRDLVITPTDTLDYDYFGPTPCAGCAPGRLSELAGPDGETLTFAYNGRLPTGVTWSGDVAGAVSFGYDTDFRVTTETVTSASPSSIARFGYDTQGLVTCASMTSCSPVNADALTLTYHPQHGRITNLALSTTTEAFTYSTFGELATQSGVVGGSTVFSESYNDVAAPRDALGRIKRKIETLEGTTTTFDYVYDLQGRLTTVSEGGVLARTYAYDSNGNRLSLTTPGGTTSATYDDQDRLLTYGAFTYEYGANGELTTKTDTGTSDVWGYVYDVFGNLRRVDLPNSDVIEYVVDGFGRRVGKKRNGTLEKQWLYRNRLGPVAELDGSGNLVARFVYGTRPNVPDYVVKSGVRYRIYADQLGSLRLVVDATTGVVAQKMRHDEWGNVLEDTAPGFVPFGFAGGIYDVDTGLLRFGARDYDSMVGRWTAKDPILFDGQQANLYLYVGDDPLNFTDITGLVDGVPDWLLYLDDSGALQAAGDFSAGVSAALTFGLSDLLIGATGLDEYGNKCSMARGLGELSGAVLGFAAGGEFALAGREISLGRNLRFAPFGNRTPHRIGRWPHYHRRGAPATPGGPTTPGQGIGRHRPWERSPHDGSFWDRF